MRLVASCLASGAALVASVPADAESVLTSSVTILDVYGGTSPFENAVPLRFDDSLGTLNRVMISSYFNIYYAGYLSVFEPDTTFNASGEADVWVGFGSDELGYSSFGGIAEINETYTGLSSGYTHFTLKGESRDIFDGESLRFFSNGEPELAYFSAEGGVNLNGSVFWFDEPHLNQSDLYAEIAFFYTPTSAVPEPATWAMMIIGFGAIGGAMRRRRANVSLSYA